MPFARHVLATVVAGCLAVLPGAPAALAGFTPVASPGSTAPVVGFAASQGAWLIGQAGFHNARISHDHGQTWSDVALPVTGPFNSGPNFAGISVGPDGAFYLAGVYAYAPTPGAFALLLRVNPADGAVSTVSTLPVADGASRVSAPAFDGQGRSWLAWVPANSSALTFARIAGGAAVESYQASTTPRAQSTGEIQFRPSGAWVTMGGEVFRLSGGALTRVAHGMPSLEEGPLIVTDRVSLDGGQSFYNTTRGAFAVEGDTTLLGDDSGIMRRYSPSLFAATAARWPAGAAPVNRVLATDGGFVALHDEWRRPLVTQSSFNMLWHPGPATDLPFSTGPLSGLFSDWLTEANKFRAQAGLAPLVGEPSISAAAENHSRYWTLNTPSAGLSVHDEQPGTPGFTGVDPAARCAATGTPSPCSSEVSSSLTDAVGWWASSVYHRFLIMAPTALFVGGGRVSGGPAIMNGGQSGGLLVGPVMFPRGTYDGPASFSYEHPTCDGGLQPPDPLGPAISVWVPGGTLSGFTLSPAGGQPLPACTLSAGSVLLPAHPLARGTYTASVNWQPSATTPSQPITWQFTSTSDPAAQGPGFFTFPITPVPVGATANQARCTSSLRRVAAAVRKPTRLGVRVHACGRATATVRIYRLHPRTAAQRRALARKTLKLPRAGTVIMRLATRHLPTGRLALRATLNATKPRHLNTTITIRAPRRYGARPR